MSNSSSTLEHNPYALVLRGVENGYFELGKWSLSQSGIDADEITWQNNICQRRLELFQRLQHLLPQTHPSFRREIGITFGDLAARLYENVRRTARLDQVRNPISLPDLKRLYGSDVLPAKFLLVVASRAERTGEPELTSWDFANGTAMGWAHAAIRLVTLEARRYSEEIEVPTRPLSIEETVSGLKMLLHVVETFEALASTIKSSVWLAGDMVSVQDKLSWATALSVRALLEGLWRAQPVFTETVFADRIQAIVNSLEDGSGAAKIQSMSELLEIANAAALQKDVAVLTGVDAGKTVEERAVIAKLTRHRLI
jgi:hypothetical protein